MKHTAAKRQMKFLGWCGAALCLASVSAALAQGEATPEAPVQPSESKAQKSEPEKKPSAEADQQDAPPDSGAEKKSRGTQAEAAAAASTETKPMGEAPLDPEDPFANRVSPEQLPDSGLDGEETPPAAQPSPEEKDSAVSPAQEKEPKPVENEAEDGKKEPKPVDTAWTYHQKHIDVMSGVVVGRTADDDLMPFLDAPVMVEGFLRAGAAPLVLGRLSLAILGEFGGSRSSSSMRGYPTSLSFLHLTAGLEPRLHLHRRVYVYARGMVGAELAKIGLEPGDWRYELRATDWALRADASLGAAVRVVGSSAGSKRAPRLYLFAEGGYRYSRRFKMDLLPPVEDDEDLDYGPARPQELSIEPFSPRGFQASVGVMGAF